MADEAPPSLLQGLKQTLMPVAGRLPAYTRLLARLYRDPATSRRQRLWLAAGLGYSLSPVDLIPGLIPGLGQLDDLYAVLSTLNRVLGQLPPERRGAHLTAVGLDPLVLEEDLERIRVAMGLLVRAGLRGAGRALAWTLRQTGALGGATLRLGWRAATRVWRRTGRTRPDARPVPGTSQPPEPHQPDPRLA